LLVVKDGDALSGEGLHQEIGGVGALLVVATANAPPAMVHALEHRA
jgi:hypothetical protein